MTNDVILRVIKTLLFVIAGSCIYIGMDNMKKAFQCKKNAMNEKERLHGYGWRILIIISISFFIAAFLLIVLAYYVYTRIAGTG